MKRVCGVLKLFSVGLVLSGCGYPYVGGNNSPAVPQSYSLDAVKQISPSVTDGDDPQTYGQARYDVGPSARVLLRFESFKNHASHVDLGTNNSKKVQVQVTVESDPDQARDLLKLCPLTSDWMMLATWRFAHPFGSAGQWKAPGADYTTVDCQKPEPPPASPGADYKPEKLLFDMTQWFIDYPRGRSINYGWVLTASGNVQIVGETSPSSSPRVNFDKFLGY